MKKKPVIIAIVVAIVIAIVIILACVSCSSQPSSQNEQSESTVEPNTPPEPEPSDNPSSDSSSESGEDTSDSSSDASDDIDYSPILDSLGARLSDQATALSSAYEKAKFAEGKSDAELSQLASDSYDELKSVYQEGVSQLQTKRDDNSGTEEGYKKAEAALEQTYSNALHRLKDDISNLNS